VIQVVRSNVQDVPPVTCKMERKLFRKISNEATLQQPACRSIARYVFNISYKREFMQQIKRQERRRCMIRDSVP
jgi:hypothetical protein